MKYRQSRDFMLKNITGDDVLIARGKAAMKVNGVFVFNESCSYLWKNMAEPVTLEEMVKLFQSEYGIDEDTAEHDIDVCLKEMLANGMIEAVDL